MKLLFSFCMLCCIYSYGQNNADKIYNATTLKRGFYKTYEEYLNNAPSINDDFTVKYQVFKKEDSSVLCADYLFKNASDRAGNVWGFCDGKDVFIKRVVGAFEVKFYRLVYRGILPLYYTIDQVGFGGIVGMVAMVASVISEDNLTLTVVDQKERKLLVRESTMRKMILNDYPDLLKSFNEAMETAKNNKSVKFNNQAKESIYKEYIIKLDKLKQAGK